MSDNGPFHRRGEPGGPGCRVGVLPIQGSAPDGQTVEGSLLDAGPRSSEVELLRTVAHGLGAVWGHDEMGWWAMVPANPRSTFASVASSPRYGLYRLDDNGSRFLIEQFASREDAEARADAMAARGHKQHYFVETMD